MNIEDEPEKYKVDLKETIYANGFKGIFSLIGMGILFMYVTWFERMIEQFSNPEMKIISLFIFAYSLLKIMFAVIPDCEIIYKLRDE